MTAVRWDPRTERIEATWVYRNDRGEHRSHSSLRMYTPTQLKALFRRVGLEIDAIYGPKGEPFARESNRMIVVGRKPSRA